MRRNPSEQKRRPHLEGRAGPKGRHEGKGASYPTGSPVRTGIGSAVLEESRSSSKKARIGAIVGLVCLLMTFLWAEGRSLDLDDDGSTGRVTAVMDGDTVDLWRDGRPWRIRLHGVDTPETGQAWGPEARAVLRDLVEGRRVGLRIRGTDVYGRILGELTLPDGRSVEEELLRRGAAWCYRRAFPGEGTPELLARRERLLRLEAEARAARRGLWGAGEEPEAPWDWRHRQRGTP